MKFQMKTSGLCFIRTSCPGHIEFANSAGPSVDRNQQDAASDIDVLKIGAPRGEVLAEVVRKIELRLGREINYAVLTRREFKSHRARKDAFLENVWGKRRVLGLFGSRLDRIP